MGTWDDGLLDNDAAHDGLADLSHGIVEDIVACGAADASIGNAETLAAAVGVLLQLSAYDFGLDAPNGPRIIAALEAQAASIRELPAGARDVLALVADGKARRSASGPGR